jgi:hypothetical protein
MLKKLALIAVLALGIAPMAQAAISYQLDNASQSGAPGDLLTFTLTLTNTSATDTVWLNGTGTTASSPFLSIDDSLFFVNAPLFLDPLAVSPAFQIFQVSIAPNAPVGPLVGSIFSILGGADVNALDDLVDITFDVNVRSLTETPEPGTIGGGFIGLLGIGWATIRRRQTAGHTNRVPSKLSHG